jgi:hypothetical protein
MVVLEATPIFDMVIDLIMAAGIIIAVISLIINRRSNYLVVMHKCMADYRRIVRELQCGKNTNIKVLKTDLLGLFNEQLYYMKWWYLPYKIRKEWKETMLRHLRNKDEEINLNFEPTNWKNFERVQDFMAKNKDK